MSRHEINDAQLTPELRRAALCIVQHSLATACRHSKSKRLFAELRLVDDMLRIKIRDWGSGFDPDDVPPGRLSLEGTRRRVKLLDGVATIQSEPDKGTSVIVELPLTSGEAN